MKPKPKPKPIINSSWPPTPHHHHLIISSSISSSTHFKPSLKPWFISFDQSLPSLSQPFHSLPSLYQRQSLRSYIGLVSNWISLHPLNQHTLTNTLFFQSSSILTIPGFISVEINFQKLLILFFLLTIISSWTYKLKVLNRYSALPKTSQLNKAIDSQLALQDLNPDSILQSHQLFSNHNHFHNYLDEFLSAIRVFGFLEKPVFHELARHLQTRRLLAGDTLSLDEDKSFYIVIELSTNPLIFQHIQTNHILIHHLSTYIILSQW